MRAALSEHFVFRVSRYSTVRDGAIEIGACGSQPADFCHEQRAEIDRPASRFLSRFPLNGDEIDESHSHAQSIHDSFL